MADANDNGPLKVDHNPEDETGTTVGSSFDVPSYELTSDEDRAIAAEILARDPVYDVPGPTTLKGAVKVPDRFTLAMISDADVREDIERQVAQQPASNRAAAEQDLLRKALEAQRLDLCVKAGLGDGASPFHREQVTLAAEVRKIDQESDRLIAELVASKDAELRPDPETGEMKPVAVPLLSMAGIERNTRRLNELLYERSLKVAGGVEYDRRVAKALQESVEVEKARREQLEDEAEIAHRLRKEERENRINARVATKLRMRNAEVK